MSYNPASGAMKARFRADLNRWEVRTTIQGKRVSTYGRSEPEALEKAQIRLEASPSYPAEPTLAEYGLRSYLPTKKGHSTAYQAKLAWAFDRLMPTLGKLRLSEVTRPALQKTFDNLKLSRQSKLDLKGILHGVLELAVADGLIQVNAAKYIALPPSRKRPIKPYNAEELARLIVASEGFGCRNAIILAALLGLRRGECLGVKWSDIKDGMLQVESQGDGRALKTHSSYRSIPLPDGLVGLLDGPQSGYISKVRDLHNITGCAASPAKKLRARGFHRVVDVAGVRGGLTFHSLRHSCSTLLVAHGCHPFVKDSILGHAKQTMGEHYTDYTSFRAQQLAALTAVYADVRLHMAGVASGVKIA